MPKKSKTKGRYNFLIDKRTYEDFSLICEEMGFVRGKMVERAMKKLVDDYKHVIKRLRDE